MGLFIYMVLFIVVAPTAFIVICVLSFLILFCPCLSYTLWRAWDEHRENVSVKENVIKSLSRVNYDARKFRFSKECAICFVDFEQDA